MMENRTFRKICVIPARGGSKRIHKKNIKPFLGSPIISYSIKAAQESGLFDEIMVSTDDNEIADIAINNGAKVPFLRSKKNADDFATTVDVILEVLKKYESRGDKFDIGCCIYPTAPFVSNELLKNTYSYLLENNFDTVFPALQFSFPIQRAIKVKENKRIELFEPEHQFTRSQDLEFAYHDAGQFYWFNLERLKEKKMLWTNNSGITPLSEMQAHDIDTEEDWRIAEFKFKMYLNEKSRDLL